MKIGRVPLIHLGRLRSLARDAGCTGLLAAIEHQAHDFLNRRNAPPVQPFSEFVKIVVTDENPEEEQAWEKFNEVIQEKYAEQERRYEAAMRADLDCEDDCTALPRLLIYIAETLPTMPIEIRAPIDRTFARTFC